MKYLHNYNIFNALLKAVCVVALIAATTVSVMGAELSFSGGRVIPVSADASTGLDKIYVVENTAGMTASYPSAAAKWSKWGNSGAAYAEPVSAAVSGNTSAYALADGDGYGITVEDGGRMHHFWIVNYTAYRVDFTGISFNEEDSDCQSLFLDITLHGQNRNYAINYYTINGAPRTLDRGYTLSYRTLAYDETAKAYNQVNKEEHLDALKATVRVDKPLCDTQFTLSGDRFAEEWGAGEQVESTTYITNAVEAMTYAEKEERDNDNEQNDQSGELGGSAPVDITFVAAVTDAVRFTEWQLSSSPEFDTYELRFNQTEVEYTFTEYGTWYMRFQASNADGTCDWFSPVYEIQIGESKLVCPNAFSPGASEGVNDEWKVSYKSIVDFECHIFNRWGVKITTLNHPSQGWDGKYNGKLVPSGVYYYVIKARGADGHKYDLSGDINIIRYNQSQGQNVTE